MAKIYPFKFLNSYGEKDADIFFGRKDEVEFLYKMVFQTNILLVCGPSGSGKTSLIMCGLASKFQSFEWLPVTIRRGNEINVSLSKKLNELANPVQPGNMPDEPGPSTTAPLASEPSSAALLHHHFKAIYRNYFRPIYLIFDQFEELYILGDRDEQKKFIETVKQILDVEQPVKIIISIREEYLGHLYEFEKAVPQLQRKKLRIEPMNLGKVQEVITGVSIHPDSVINIESEEKPKEGETKEEKEKRDQQERDQIATDIFDKIKGTQKSITIPLPYLQVFLDKLYIKITHDETHQANARFTRKAVKDMGAIDDVLRDFLEEQVIRISKKLSSDDKKILPDSIWKILSPFVTIDETKEPISKSSLLIRLQDEKLADFDKDMVNTIVEEFVSSRILRYDDVTELYEIAHDALAKPIAKERGAAQNALLEVKRLLKNMTALKQQFKALLTKSQLAYIEPYLDELSLTNDEAELITESRNAVKEQENELQKQETQKQRTQIMYWALGIVGVFLAIAIGTSIWAYLADTKAEDAYKQLQIEQTIGRAKIREAFGDEYKDLKDFDDARDSYQQGLKVLDSLQFDTTKELYKEFKKRIKECDKQ